jgi:hypothetical protein
MLACYSGLEIPTFFDINGKNGLSIGKLRLRFGEFVATMSEEEQNNFICENLEFVAQVVASCISEKHINFCYQNQPEDAPNQLRQTFDAVYKSFLEDPFEIFDWICERAEDLGESDELVFVLGHELTLVVINSKKTKKKLTISYSK